MQGALLAAAAILALVLVSRRSIAAGAEGAEASFFSAAESVVLSLEEIYQRYADQFGVDWRLVKAIAQHESGENPDAVNTRDNESIGLMQILCRPDGAGGCTNRLNVEGWPDATREGLFDADFNVYIGAQILASNIASYGVPKGIAVYNAWDQHTAPAGGPFKNQSYVDDVLRRAAKLGFSG
jgi:soluble lytic murein transglycosylase-like protein